MATYVLVHGGNVSTETWNTIAKTKPIYTASGRMGGRVWETVTPALKAQNHRFFAPTLEDEHTCNLTGHIRQICALISDNDLRNVILVGHSYGGMIITGVAAKMPERISRLVYLDAAWPNSGQSLFDMLASSGGNPLSDIAGLEPAMAYTEKLEYDPQRVTALQKVFIRCTKSELASFVEVCVKKIAADMTNWTIMELQTGHVAQATMPDELAQILLKLA